QPNSVLLSNGDIHQFASVEDTPILMHELMKTHLKNPYKSPKEPFQYAAEFHHRFVSIHPFDDGNGRVARLLTNYILMREGYPPVIIKSADKKNYYAALRLSDVSDTDIKSRTAVMQYLTDQLIWSLELSIKAAKGESIEEPEDLDKEIEIWKRSELSGKKPSIRRSSDVIFALLNTIEPILHKIIEKTNHFRELFHVVAESFQVNSTWDTGNIDDLYGKLDSIFHPVKQDPY